MVHIDEMNTGLWYCSYKNKNECLNFRVIDYSFYINLYDHCVQHNQSKIIICGQAYDLDQNGNAFIKYSESIIRIINYIAKCLLLNAYNNTRMHYHFFL